MSITGRDGEGILVAESTIADLNTEFDFVIIDSASADYTFEEHQLIAEYNEKLESSEKSKMGFNTITFRKLDDGNWVYRRRSWDLQPWSQPFASLEELLKQDV